MNKKTKNTNTSKSIKGPLFLSLIGFLVYSLCFFPSVIFTGIILYFIPLTQIWHFLILPFIIYIDIILLIVSILLISGIIIQIFHIQYNPGTYTYSFNEKNSFNWMIICALYTPCRKLLEIIPMGNLKNTYFRLIGMKIGSNSLVGGTIKDPCVTEFGNNITMGEYAVIYGHIHNYEKGTLEIKKVKIGDNCVIGAGAIIMPGAVMEPNAILAAGALVTQNQTLQKGKLYAGVPAQQITRKPGEKK